MNELIYDGRGGNTFETEHLMLSGISITNTAPILVLNSPTNFFGGAPTRGYKYMHGDLSLFATNTPSSGQVLAIGTNYTYWVTTTNSAGSAFPLTADANAAGYSITNVGTLQANILNISNANLGSVTVTGPVSLTNPTNLYSGIISNYYFKGTGGVITNQGTGTQAIALGLAASATANDTVAYGPAASATADNAIAIGFNAQALHTNSVAIGTSATTTTNNQIMLGQNTITVVVPGSLSVSSNIIGNGSGLTNLNASQLSSGDVGSDRLTNAIQKLIVDLAGTALAMTQASTNLATLNAIGVATNNQAAKALTSNVAGVTIDATTSAQLFVTNASYSISGFSGLSGTQQFLFSQTVSNSASSAITITGPPSTFYIGSVSTNSMSLAAGKEAVYSFWIWAGTGLRTNCMNCQQQ
jgi:hypothetical protein